MSSTVKPKSAEIENISTEIPSWCQVSEGQGAGNGEGRPEQLVASALAQGSSELAQKPGH